MTDPLVDVLSTRFPEHLDAWREVLGLGVSTAFVDLEDHWLLALAWSPRVLVQLQVDANGRTVRSAALEHLVGTVLVEEEDATTLTLQFLSPVGVLTVRGRHDGRDQLRALHGHLARRWAT